MPVLNDYFLPDGDPVAFAKQKIAAGGAGSVPPFYAETASVKGDESWPFWIVRNQHCNSLGKLLMTRAEAERIAAALNER